MQHVAQQNTALCMCRMADGGTDAEESEQSDDDPYGSDIDDSDDDFVPEKGGLTSLVCSSCKGLLD
jgi:hypothetical protein